MPHPSVPQQRPAKLAPDRPHGPQQKPPAHLASLLTLRNQLATTAVELTSHDLPGALAAHQALMNVEDRIEQAFPKAFRQGFPRWIRRDASLIHSDDQTHPRCQLCRQQPLKRELVMPAQPS